MKTFALLIGVTGLTVALFGRRPRRRVSEWPLSPLAQAALDHARTAALGHA